MHGSVTGPAAERAVHYCDCVPVVRLSEDCSFCDVAGQPLILGGCALKPAGMGVQRARRRDCVGWQPG